MSETSSPGARPWARLAFASLLLALALIWWFRASPGVDGADAIAGHPEAATDADRGALPLAAHRHATESSRSVATPSARTSLRRATTQAELAAAANHAYEALKLCVAAEGVRASMADPESRAFFDKYSRGEADESPDPAWRKGFSDLVARQFEVYERAKRECVGIGDRAKDGSIYELAALAAEFGNRDAASCYVSMAWPMDRAHWEDLRFRARYRALAPRLIDAGIAVGDWRMVSMARIAAGTEKLPEPPAGSTGMTATVWLSPSIRWLQASNVDAQRELALVRLKQAGAMNATWAARYGRLADHMAQSLPPAEARAAADWANRTYRTAFDGKPDLQDNLMAAQVCQ